MGSWAAWGSWVRRCPGLTRDPYRTLRESVMFRADLGWVGWRVKVIRSTECIL
jgi:hypothetical protein